MLIFPSAAILPARLAALISPAFLSTSIAVSRSPCVCVKASLQAIMAAPVRSRNILTISAVMVGILLLVMIDCPKEWFLPWVYLPPLSAYLFCFGFLLSIFYWLEWLFLLPLLNLHLKLILLIILFLIF